MAKQIVPADKIHHKPITYSLMDIHG